MSSRHSRSAIQLVYDIPTSDAWSRPCRTHPFWCVFFTYCSSCSPRHCVAKEIGRASKVDGRDARIHCRENEKNKRKEKDFVKSEYKRRTIWLHHGTIHDSCVGTSIAAAIILSSSMANRLLLIDETNVLILIFSDDDEWRAQISGWHHKTCLFCFFGEGPNFIPRGLKSTFDPPTIRDALTGKSNNEHCVACDPYENISSVRVEPVTRKISCRHGGYYVPQHSAHPCESNAYCQVNPGEMNSTSACTHLRRRHTYDDLRETFQMYLNFF